MMKNRKLGTLAVFDRIKCFIRFCGLWPYGISSKYVSMLYSGYSVAMITLLFVYDISISAYIFFIENVQEATDNLTTSFTLIALFGKMLSFRYFLRKIQSLFRMADEFQLENDRETEFADRQMLFFNRLVIFSYCSANMAISFNCISAIMSASVRLPYLAWFPFDWHKAYAWVYAYQVIGVAIQANLNITLDLLMAYLMHVASIKFQLLGVRLQKLSELKEGGRSEQHTRDLIRCIKVYQRICKYTKDLQKCFTYGLLIQINFSGAVICSLAYQMTITSPVENFVFFTSLANYQLCMIGQIFIPCYFGNEIILKHENITGSIFQCGWHFRPVHYRRFIIIFMEIVRSERHILVGNWIVLDLNLFVSIMNFAYRLYTVLV